MIGIARGDVVLADLEGAEGYERKGRMGAVLCVVIQNDRGNAVSPLTIVAPLSDISAYKNLPFQITVTGSERGPLNKDSIVECSQIRTLDRFLRIKKNIGPLPPAVMERVDRGIKAILAL